MVETVVSQAKIVTQTIRKPHRVVTYPQVRNLRNQRAQFQINSRIFELVYELIRLQGMGLEEGEMNGDYEIMLNERGLLSVRLENYSIRFQAANGQTLIGSATFDLVTGHEYTLEELFVEGSDYVSKLSEIIKQQIEMKEIVLIAPFDKIAPDQNFYLTPDSLVIYFQELELTPHYYGPLYFEIPYSQLTDLINVEGPIGRFS